MLPDKVSNFLDKYGQVTLVALLLAGTAHSQFRISEMAAKLDELKQKEAVVIADPSAMKTLNKEEIHNYKRFAYLRGIMSSKIVGDIINNKNVSLEDLYAISGNKSLKPEQAVSLAKRASGLLALEENRKDVKTYEKILVALSTREDITSDLASEILQSRMKKPILSLIENKNFKPDTKNFIEIAQVEKEDGSIRYHAIREDRVSSGLVKPTDTFMPLFLGDPDGASPKERNVKEATENKPATSTASNQTTIESTLAERCEDLKKSNPNETMSKLKHLELDAYCSNESSSLKIKG